MGQYKVKYSFWINCCFVVSDWDHISFIQNRHQTLKVSDYFLGELFLLEFGHQTKTTANFYIDHSFAFIGSLHDQIELLLEVENNEIWIKIFNEGQKVFEKKKIFSKFPTGIHYEGVKLTNKRALPFECKAKITQIFLTKKPNLMFLLTVLSWFKGIFTKTFINSLGKFFKRNWIAVSLFGILLLSLLVLLFKINNLRNDVDQLSQTMVKKQISYDSLANLRNVEKLTIQVEIDYLTNQLAKINNKTNESQILLDSLNSQPATMDNYAEKLRAVRHYINERRSKSDRH